MDTNALGGELGFPAYLIAAYVAASRHFDCTVVGSGYDGVCVIRLVVVAFSARASVPPGHGVCACVVLVTHLAHRS